MRRPSWQRARPVLRKALLAGLLLLAIPPLARLAGDLWLLVRAGGGGDGVEARSIVLRSVLAGESRAAERRWLLGDRPPAATQGGSVIVFQPPPPNPAETIPMCAGSTFQGDGAGEIPAHAYAAADTAQFLLTAERLGMARVVALDLCFNASPFSGWCDAPLDAARAAARRGVAEEAIRIGAARRENGRACWCERGPCSWEDRPRSDAR